MFSININIIFNIYGVKMGWHFLWGAFRLVLVKFWGFLCSDIKIVIWDINKSQILLACMAVLKNNYCFR